MAKLFIVFSTFLALQVCIEAATSAGFNPDDTKIEQGARVEEDGPTLDSKPHGLYEETNSKDGISSQGQRQKRFYNYFNFGFTPYGPYNPTYAKRDNTQDTGIYGTEDPLSQIFKRVQELLSLTRQQAYSPPPASHIPVPSYIPVFYIPHFGCSCTPDNNNQGPSNDEEPDSEVSPAPLTTTITTPTIITTPTMSPAIDNVPVNPSNNSDTNNTTPDFFSRLPDMGMEYDDEDGTRPISFEPVKPNRTLSRPPPPVDHGSSQAGEITRDIPRDSVLKQEDAPRTTIRPAIAQGVPAAADLPTNAIPTLCDGAVLTCCHRSEVTFDCFTKQGCPYPVPADNPCEENVILNVIRKFQYYYASRKVSNQLL